MKQCLDWHEIQELRDKYNKLIEESGAILDKADREHRELTGEEAQTFDRLHRQTRQAKAEAECAESEGGRLGEDQKPKVGIVAYDRSCRGLGLMPSLDDPDATPISDEPLSAELRDRWMDQSTGREIRVLGPKDSFRSVIRDGGDAGGAILSLGKTLRGIITNNWRGAEAEQRATLSSGGSAGFLLSPALSAIVLDFARAKSSVLSAGAQVVPIEGAELTLARIESDPVASWRPENVSLNDTTINFAAIHLKPKTVGALIKLPIELAEDASNLEPIVSAALTAALGNELDRALLFGDGATEVKGLKSYIGDADQPVGTQDPTGPLTDYDDFSLAQQAIKQANFKANAVIMSPRSAGQLDRAKTGITNDLTPLTPPQSWAELTKFVTSQVLDTFSGTESDAFVGQFNQLLVGMRSQIIVEANRQAGDSFSKLQVFIRAYMRVDAALARAGAFQIVTGIEA